MKYCTIAETAKRWNVSKTLVRRYLQQDRIPTELSDLTNQIALLFML